MFTLPDLPYAYEALEPIVSADTLHQHHDKHHAKYVSTLNELRGADAPRQSLEEVVTSATPGKLYNNAAQTWNHSFFWDSMTPGGASPGNSLKQAGEQTFGDWASLRTKFVAEGVGHFASGWVWLTARAGTLQIVSTHDAGSFDQLDGATPLLVCDVWEHAYYLDHQSDRKGFLEQWFDGLANWMLADRQLAASAGQGQPWRFPQPAG